MNKISAQIIEAAILNQNISISKMCDNISFLHSINVKGICFPSSVVNIAQLRAHIEQLVYTREFDVIGVVGYPNGDVTASAKLAEVNDLCGFATILDVVLNPIYIQSEMWQYVRGELIEIMMSTNAEIRWIIETPRLTEDQIITVSNLILETGGHIKTASGTKGPTSFKDVRLIRKVIDEHGKNIILKASGGIKSKEVALDMLSAGANLLGCSTPSELLL